MGFFESDDHLFAYYEKSTIEKKYLNIFKIAGTKNVEFISRDEYSNYTRYHTQTNSDSINYNFLINSKNVTFVIQKVIIASNEHFEKRYNNFASYLFTGKHYGGKIGKGGHSYIGLPDVNPDWFPYTILEISSGVTKKNKKAETKKIYDSQEYLQFLNLRSSWHKDVERDFHIISDKIIKETIKKTK